jgi:predicted enzyme involved in methoxymalonyl-ACP biosynthesis
MFLRDCERSLDYLELIARNKDTDDVPCRTSVRAAILSDAATQQLVPLLNVLFKDHCVLCDFYEGIFDGIELEVQDAASGLYRFDPDTIILLHSVQALIDRYYKRPGTGNDFLESEMLRIERILDTIRARSAAAIVVSNSGRWRGAL